MSISKIFKYILALLGISFILAFVYAVGLSKWIPGSGNSFLDSLGWIFKGISYYCYCFWSDIVDKIANWLKTQTPEITTQMVQTIAGTSGSVETQNFHVENGIVLKINGSKYICYPIS